MDERPRLEALMAVNRLAIQDSDFRREARRHLASTLGRHGFNLRPQELRIIEEFSLEVGNLSDGELLELLKKQTGQDRWC